MNLVRGIQERIGAVVAAVGAGILFLICGAIMAFVISPQQALEWRRIQNLPQLDASSYASTAAGKEVAVTGTLKGNTAITDDGLVAYERQKWEVTEPNKNSNDNSEPSGSWNTIEENAPALTLEVTGGTVQTISATSVDIDGAVHETLQKASGGLTADYNDEPLADGSIRTRGFKDGDLLTVVGHKSTVGGIAPDRLYGGDRTQLVEDIRSGAQVLFGVGIGMMVCAPIVVVLGILAAMFGRNRGGGRFTIG